MIKHAILVGINSIPELPYLSSPSKYAIKMKNWAQSQGYTTHLFVDEEGEEQVSGRCRRTDILDVSRRIVDEGCDQLLVYFAGHGVELTAGDDIWLLPGYVDDGADCISILSCQQYAYRTGIKHVVFISDACRSPSNNPLIRPVVPSSIFPNRNFTNHRTVVDIFYSTWPGENSRDIRSEDSGDYHSLYSDSLLECLHGTVPEVIKEIENIIPKFPAVLSFELNNYLKNEVPEKFRLAGSKVQYPTGTVSSCDPLFLSKFSHDGAEESNTETALSTIVDTDFRRVETKTIDQKLDSFLKTKSRTVKSQTKKIIQDFIKDYKLFTSSGISTSGSTALYVPGFDGPTVLSSREKDFYSNEEQWRPKRRRDFSSIETLDFSDIGPRGGALYFVANRRHTRFYPVNVLYGFITQVAFEKDELLSVNYFPTHGYHKEEAHNYAREIAERKAQIILAAKNGMFQGTQELGDYLRKYKHLDPTLGLFAAYAYFQKGDFEGVNNVFDIIASDDGQPMLGDIWMLKKLSSDLYMGESDEISLPLITEGWSYLNMLEENRFEHLSKYLQPGLWTSFNRDGMTEIRKILNLEEL